MNLGNYQRTLHIEPVKLDETAPAEKAPETPQAQPEPSRATVTVETPEPVSA